ncbi:MAG TPA: hypothetical protein DDX54_02155 [Rhodospirillaceae bacterium]|jgi:hypothetical protein|nr:hypothetical protein [Alphaproteobacteria bacterium]HBH26189.1 hypothetical protein [Rhodospirillaceae bacterium]
MPRAALLSLLCLVLSSCAGAPAAPEGPPWHAETESTGLRWAQDTPRLDADLWRGSTRAEVLTLLDLAPAAKPGVESWPALRPLVGRALTAPIGLAFLADGAEPPEPGRDLLTARVEALLALDEPEKAAALYSALAAEPYGARLAKAGVTAFVRSGQTPLACVEAALASLQADSQDPFWADIRARCAEERISSAAAKARPAVVVPDPVTPASLPQVREAFVQATRAGQGVPEAWVAALDALEIPRTAPELRLYAFLQAAAAVEAPAGEAASRLEAARDALADDSQGQALFAERAQPLIDAPRRSLLEINVSKKYKDKPKSKKNPYGNAFSLTEGKAYVMDEPVALAGLHRAVTDQSAGRVALAAALLLSGQEPGSHSPGAVAEAVGALAGMGLATTAERVAEQAICAATQEL